MPNAYRSIAFTPSVRAAQEANNSRIAADNDAPGVTVNDRLTDSEALFLARADSLYLATVSETGWPYMQHRGGPAGFVKVLDDTTIGWAEFAGNRQYVTTGNLAAEERVSLFVMDYARRRRLKIFGRATLIGMDDPRMTRLAPDGYRARLERGMIIRVAGIDWNCPQHIPQLFTPDQVAAATEKMMARIAELEAGLDGNT